LDDPEYLRLKKQLSFNLKEKSAIRQLNIQADAFLPVLFSLKFGGDWSFKTRDLEALAVKEKITRYNEDIKEGYTMERVTLLVNPQLIGTEGRVLRLEKCGNKKERELVERPYQVELQAEDIILAELDPKSMEIVLRRIDGPLFFEGSAAYGVSHEMEHLEGQERSGKYLWEFDYRVE